MARASLEGLVVDHRLDRDRLDRLLKAMQAETREVKAAALGVIGRGPPPGPPAAHRPGPRELHLPQAGGRRSGQPSDRRDRLRLRRRRAGGRLLLVGLNNSTALSEAGAFRELGVDGLGGLLGRQYAGEDAPIAFVLHLTGARLSFTDRGKSAVAL